ncbi:hypothetical protein V866_001757 [Kwoniella sp. B9012]
MSNSSIDLPPLSRATTTSQYTSHEQASYAPQGAGQSHINRSTAGSRQDDTTCMEDTRDCCSKHKSSILWATAGSTATVTVGVVGAVVATTCPP